MQIDVTSEVLVSQLGYTKSESSLAQAQRIINNTKGFEKFSKHIIVLHDQLEPLKAYVAMSNNKDNLKIKCDENDAKEIIEEFTTLVNHFSEKYNVELEKVEGKELYYIIGVNN